MVEAFGWTYLHEEPPVFRGGAISQVLWVCPKAQDSSLPLFIGGLGNFLTRAHEGPLFRITGNNLTPWTFEGSSFISGTLEA